MIAAEDRRFFSHGGVDGSAVARAALQNLRARRIAAGGSTITLQLARMLRPAPRTFGTKVLEAFRAWRLEAGMTKEEILEEYLNRVPMGGNLYGVEAAARAYFGLSAADLSLAQASYLAAIPNSPTRLNPFRNPEAVRRRQGYVLDRMAAAGAIDGARVRLAVREELSLRSPEASFLAPHFVFHLLETLPEGVQSVETTLDSSLQRLLVQEVQDTLRRLEGRRVTNAAALLVANNGGEVLAYVGSADFFDDEAEGRNDGVQALRQPGSTLKPILYGLAFERDFTTASLLADVPVILPMPEGVFRPSNYDETFLGPVRARVALASSLNIPAVRLVSELGVGAFLERLRLLGFSSLDRNADYYGAGLALGSGEVRLSELASAYLALASGGRRTPLRSLRTVDGTQAGNGPAAHPLYGMEERAAFLVTDVLGDRFARAAAFGADSVLALPFPCAVKTGTSFRFADNWTVGYTVDYTLAVWVGNFDGSPMQEVSGVSGAGPLFARVMAALYEGRASPPAFPRPEGLVDVEVCSLSGRRPRPACPQRIVEILPGETLERLAEPCDMHLSGATVYPPPFTAWAREAGLTEPPEEDSAVPERHDGENRIFSIARPGDGDLFRRTADLSPEYQSVVFELGAFQGAAEVHWLLDGGTVAVTSPPHRLLWNARPGRHRLTATAGTHSDTVVFTVR